MTQTDMTQTEPPKRYVYANGKRQPTAFQYATSRNDGTSLVCYRTTAGPDGLVFAVFDDEDLDIARACHPAWHARRGVYYIARYASVAERAAGRGGLVMAYQLIVERMLGRPLAAGQEEVIDHIDGDPLNNRRQNLRVLSNRLNVALQTDVKNGDRLPGASFSAHPAAKGRTKCWRSCWREPGQHQQHLGWFATEFEAFAAWASKMERVQPGWRIALAAHPALLTRLECLTAAERRLD